MHLLSATDSTKHTEIKRKHHGDYKEIECSDSIKKYNSEMDGVAWYNKLMSLFSVGNHIFKKY